MALGLICRQLNQGPSSSSLSELTLIILEISFLLDYFIFPFTLDQRPFKTRRSVQSLPAECEI